MDGSSSLGNLYLLVGFYGGDCEVNRGGTMRVLEASDRPKAMRFDLIRKQMIVIYFFIY